MARRRSNGHKGLKAFLVIFLILGVGVGVTAAVTKGFKQWGEAEMVKGGVSVDKFDVDKLQGGTLTLVNKDDVKLTATIEGEINEEEKLILGDSKEVAATTKSELETTLDGYKLAPKQVEEVEGIVLAMDLCKLSTFNISLNVEYKKDSAASGAKELPWFNAVRVNYKIANPRFILTANASGEETEVSYKKRINTVTPLYENIDLSALKDDATLTENNISFVSFSIEADKDNTIEIQSIELIRTTMAKHQNDLCWVTQ